jgi:hypothetical protein
MQALPVPAAPAPPAAQQISPPSPSSRPSSYAAPGQVPFPDNALGCTSAAVLHPPAAHTACPCPGVLCPCTLYFVLVFFHPVLGFGRTAVPADRDTAALLARADVLLHVLLARPCSQIPLMQPNTASASSLFSGCAARLRVFVRADLSSFPLRPAALHHLPQRCVPPQISSRTRESAPLL